MGRAVCDAWRTPPAPRPMTQLESCKLALIVLFFNHYVPGDIFLTGRMSPVKKEMTTSLTFVWVRTLFSFTLGLLNVGLTEDVCSSEAKSQAPTPRCHLSLSYYTPAFTVVVLRHATTHCEETCRRFNWTCSLTWFWTSQLSAVRIGWRSPMIWGCFTVEALPRFPCTSGWKFIPFARTQLCYWSSLLELSRTCRLDSKGLKWICGEIWVMVHQVSVDTTLSVLGKQSIDSLGYCVLRLWRNWFGGLCLTSWPARQTL